MTQAVVEGGQR